MTSTAGRSVAIIGGGWAGLSAALAAMRRGLDVTLFEMAPQLGGRARDVVFDGGVLDNGQHILIGAYTETLNLLRTLGIDAKDAFVRTPLRLATPSGRGGLELPPGAPVLAFARGVLAQRGWRLADRLTLLAVAGGWAARRFRCDDALTVAALTARLPEAVRRELIEPLCVAALNTPSAEASARVFLRVLRDALFTGPGSADLLLPRVGLSALLPTPALNALGAARVRMHTRVSALAPEGTRWRVDGETFDTVVLATPPGEAARLVGRIAPDWTRAAAALHFEPIVTVYLRSAGTRLHEAMLMLAEGPDAPAQFVFDRGQLGGPEGLLAFVISGAQPWVDRGLAETTAATRRQAEAQLGTALRGALQPVHTIAEKRATFRCTPGLVRPSAAIAPGLWAVGDHLDGPYPATLEGAVRSGLAVAARL